MHVRFVKFSVLHNTPRRFAPAGYKMLDNTKGPPLRRWLIRKMWQWLHNCGALEPYYEMVHDYEFGEAEQTNIIDAINHQMYRLFRDGQNPHDYVILVGAADFYDLTGAVAREPMSFTQTLPMMWSDRQETGWPAMEIRGLPVHVVPLMQGITMVPKIAVERRK